MSECCKTGFKWNGKPTGKEGKLGPRNAYIAGTNTDNALLMVHDVFGWTLPNLRLLADSFAEECKMTVYLVDYYDGEVVDPETMENPALREKFDMKAFFFDRHSKEKRGPEIEADARELKSKYKHVAAIGYCWGAWAVFKIAAKGKNILSSAAVAHPSLLEKADIDNLAVPTLIMAPETDPQFTPELKEYSNKVIPTLGIDYQYSYFPGLVHGWSVRGDPSDPKQKAGLERAKRTAACWFTEYNA